MKVTVASLCTGIAIKLVVALNTACLVGIAAVVNYFTEIIIVQCSQMHMWKQTALELNVETCIGMVWAYLVLKWIDKPQHRMRLQWCL